MKKKSKYLIIIVLILVLAILSLVLTAFRARTTYQEGMIDVAITWGDGDEELQSFFDEYEDAEGRSVVVDSKLREGDIVDLLSGDNPPDVVILSTSEMIEDISSAGDLASMDEVIRANGMEIDDFFSASISQCRSSDNKLRCLPWGNDVYALYWNKELFAQAGLDPERPPESLEELEDYAAKLTHFDAETGEYAQVGFLLDFPRSYLDQYIHLFGGSWQIAGGSLELAPAVEEAVKWEMDFMKPFDLEALNSFFARTNKYRNSGHPSFAGRRANCQQCHRTSPGNSEKMPDLAFYQGEIAMMVDGQWQDGSKYLSAFAPTLDYGVAPLPSPADFDEFRGSSLIQGPVMIIPAGAKDGDAAAELVAWLLSPERQAEAAAAFDFLPSRISALDFMTSAKYPNLAVFLSILNDKNTSAVVPLEGVREINRAVLEGERKVLHEALLPELFFSEVQNGLE